MIIAGIDTETTGLDNNKSADIEIVEIGYAIFDTDHDLLISAGSELFATKIWGEDAEKIHGIPQWATQLANHSPSKIDIASRILAYKPELMVAHNAKYDYEHVVKHWPGLDNSHIKWLCTRDDLPHDQLLPKVASTRLMHLAVDYGIQISGWHRAMMDAIMCCKIAAKHDLSKILANLVLPRFKVVARGRYSDDGIAAVKNLKFRWDTENKVWWRDNFTEVDAKSAEQAIKKVVSSWSVEITAMPPRML